MAAQSALIVVTIVAEDLSTCRPIAVIEEQPRLVEVAQLMAQVPDHRAVCLTEFGSALLAARGVRLSQVDGDQAVVMTGYDGLAL